MADETIENEEAPVAEASGEEPAAPAEEAAPAPKRASRSRAAKARSEGDTPEAVEEAPAAEPVAEPAAEAPKKATRPRAAAKKAEPAKKPAKERGTYVRTPAAESEQGQRRERRGVVVSDKGDKTITVRIDVMKAHPKYKKIMRRSIKLHAHDEQNVAKVGDVVRVVETRPLSATKRWRLVEVVEEAR